MEKQPTTGEYWPWCTALHCTVLDCTFGCHYLHHPDGRDGGGGAAVHHGGGEYIFFINLFEVFLFIAMNSLISRPYTYFLIIMFKYHESFLCNVSSTLMLILANLQDS